MADIVYTFENQVYLNITNACPCRCKFCIRNNGDSVGEATTLWFDHNPSIDEIKNEIDKFDFSKYNNSIIICGYGEPTCALDNMIEACKHLKSKGISIRLNTNGHGNLINGEDITLKLKGIVDKVNVSLNAPDSDEYIDVCRPVFGEDAYEGLIDFAKRCKSQGIDVVFSVVDCIGEKKVNKCKKLAKEVGIPLRVREMIEDSDAT